MGFDMPQDQLQGLDVLLGLALVHLQHLHHLAGVDQLQALQEGIQQVHVEPLSTAVIGPGHALHDVVDPAAGIVGLLVLHELQEGVGDVLGASLRNAVGVFLLVADAGRTGLAQTCLEVGHVVDGKITNGDVCGSELFH